MKSYIEGVDKSKIQIQRTKLEHKQKESQSVLETVDNYKEIKNFQAFDFFYDNWEQITNTLRDLIFKTDLRILLKKSVFILIESMSYAFLFLIAKCGMHRWVGMSTNNIFNFALGLCRVIQSES